MVIIIVIDVVVVIVLLFTIIKAHILFTAGSDVCSTLEVEELVGDIIIIVISTTFLRI
jgi:hypothetical protein